MHLMHTVSKVLTKYSAVVFDLTGLLHNGVKLLINSHSSVNALTISQDYKIQWNLDLMTLLVSIKTVTKLHSNVAKWNDFM